MHGENPKSVQEYLPDPDEEGTVIIPNVVHVTAHKTTYIYIEGVGQQTSEKI
jgi:hypothetical protein